ncbi:hypothetical protein RGR602_PB00405 (plasmid) [Rhizobium gallicum bv. gallicum R602sp]|uniref:Uncharacterized protein n=1 Tax=Rhizobium gallicum bv. gallicum R602sp TaxID=1041138 RepID=A0A0B4X9Z8_9HYPH|nr:hypothetical protein RGR602_PB00405 [Rhizobium gallicum bv. gallicum R602sp]
MTQVCGAWVATTALQKSCQLSPNKPQMFLLHICQKVRTGWRLSRSNTTFSRTRLNPTVGVGCVQNRPLLRKPANLSLRFSVEAVDLGIGELCDSFLDRSASIDDRISRSMSNKASIDPPRAK